MSGKVNINQAEHTEQVQCFLGVDSSFADRRWLFNDCDERRALALAQRLDVPEIVGRVLSSRDISMQEAEDFLHPTLKRMLPDPRHLKDMDVACERLCAAIMQGEKIAVYGDYDVDGATSSALLKRFITAVGKPPRVYIPDRLREGYGPNSPALLALKKDKVSLVVMLDCGITAHDPLKVAFDAGLEVIVVDHHKADPLLPDAVAVINPNRLDEESPHGHLAAVGLTFLLVVALNRTLDEAGWFKNRIKPNPMNWLDLVALGTVCDVVPLVGVNRALAAQGLKVMANRGNPGLKALADISAINETPGAYHAGFILGPRINAGGRIGDASLGSRLLSTDDDDEAREIAVRLDELNRQRREIEAVVLDQAMDQADEQVRTQTGDRLIVVAAEGWHPGVIGIVASRIVERFNRPACVVAIDGDVAYGSGRSLSGVDLGAAIIAACKEGLLIKGGGHAMAAGFSVKSAAIKPLHRFLSQRIGEAGATSGAGSTLRIDASLSVSGASMELASALEMLAPFGSGNPEPVFVIPRARISRSYAVGENHLRCFLSGDGGGRLEAIAFRCMDKKMGAALLHHDGAAFHIAGRLRLNTWQGRTKVQMLIDDAAPLW